MVRVELYLVDVRCHALIEQALQVRWLEVGRTDGAHQASTEQRDQARESLDIAILVGVGPVHQQQIEIVQPEAAQARLAGLAGTLDAVPLAVEFGGDEHLGAVNAGIADALTDPALIFIVLCGVDEAIADAQCTCDGDGGLGVVHRPRAEAELRHLHAIGEGEGGCGIHGHGLLKSSETSWSRVASRK